MRFLPVMALSCLISLPLSAAEVASDIKMFPPAGKEEQRLVIRLPKLSHEENSKVEILIGQQKEVDCNLHRMSGDLQENNLQGWGYSYYRLEKVGPMISTRMACAPKAKPKSSFVPVVGNGYLLRYNSKLPIVIYAPNGFTVNYRLWHAEEENKHASAE
jgi:Serine protease inhibitor ecotin